MNKVILIGNLGKAPEVKHLQTGNTVTSFSLATSERYKNKAGEKVEETQWHNIILWGKQAEIAEKYLTKGSKICIEGKLTYRSWEDKDGNKRYVTEIVGSNFTILSTKHESKPQNHIDNDADKNDDLPF